MTTSPFLTLWLQPRATMRDLLQREPSHWVIWLAILASISQALFGLFDMESKPEQAVPVLVFFALTIGFAGGLIGLYLSTYLLRWTGRWLGGQEDSYAIRSAVGWSSLPTAFSLLLLVPLVLLIGAELVDPTWMERAVPGQVYLFLAISVAQVVLAIWGMVMLVKCLAEVQEFSAWRALANVLLSITVFVVPFILLGALFGALA